MQKLMNQYFVFLSQIGKQADKVLIEMRDIEKGILQLIAQHGIRWLIMGAGAETFNSKKLSETNSSKAMAVYQQAPSSCHIWFISKGSFIYARPAGSGSHSTTAASLSPSRSTDGTTLTLDPKGNVDVDAENVHYLNHRHRSTEEVVSTMNPTAPTTGQSSGDGSPLFLKVKCPEHLQC
ncbi:Ubiquitin--protein ligase [Handroanthus impetiginosus]|uniref:RING-type E3 ubiquitin transferase n=1 Tax=Handroanthus impetiginosus TaxID=429701 RepID=A0A2G9FZU6_9LAMI|nr:Ubiquitin--protein ligase [Handroanthus impetiginosus]